MERKRAKIIIGAIVAFLIALLIFAALVLPGRRKLSPKAQLTDGRVLQVEGVTFGTYQQMGFKSLVENAGPWLPRKIYDLLTPKFPYSEIHLDRPGLVVWVNAIDPVTGKYVDCQSIRVEVLGEKGDVFSEDTSSWFGSPNFWRVGHVFYAFPRAQSAFTVQVTPWKTNTSVRFEIPNPHVTQPAAWSGQALPQHQLVGDLDVALTGLLLRTNGSSAHYWESPSRYWSPVWELRQAGNPAAGWEEPEWIAEDPTGNRSQFLGVNQRVERFSGIFYPSPTNTQAAILVGSSPLFSVHDLQSNIWWNLKLNYEKHPISVLGVFTNGTHVFLDGVYQPNPPAGMGPVDGGAPSGWVGQSRRVSLTKVNEWTGHYTQVPVIYIQAQGLRSTERLAVRLRDDQGRYWLAKPELQGNSQGISPFLLEKPEEIGEISAEFVVLKPVEAQFLVQMPGPPLITAQVQTDSAEASIPVEEPSRANPVTAAVAANKQGLGPGDTFELRVRVRIAGSHYIYSTNSMRGPFTSTRLTLNLPNGIEALGDWSAPAPTRTKTGDSVYRDSVVFRRPLKVLPDATPGELPLTCELLYQACSEELCWPPKTIRLPTSVTIRNQKKD